jgi:hypothetical protein
VKEGAGRWKMESEEYMNRKQQGAERIEVSILLLFLLLLLLLIIIIIMVVVMVGG